MSSYQVGDVTVYYSGSEGSPLKSVTGGPVRYEDIRATYSANNLYEDPDFPATHASIGELGGDAANAKVGKPTTELFWKRPWDIMSSLRWTNLAFAYTETKAGSSPEMCSFEDLHQGALADCWYVAALQALTTRQDQLKLVIPEDNFNGFDPDKYCGAFHFRFYHAGASKWVDIVVDDRIPCCRGTNNSYYPYFLSCTAKGASTCEFWPVLIEKAYAKFMGDYHAIEGGWASQALSNFTAGFSEILKLDAPLDDFKLFGKVGNRSRYDVIKSRIDVYIKNKYFIALDSFDPNVAATKGALYAYSRDKDTGYVYDARANKVVNAPGRPGLGLVGPHVYTVIDAAEVRLRDGSGTKFLLKVRNPHATNEWQGEYSDTDDYCWSLLEQDLRKRDANTGSTNIDEGVFWIELDAVIKCFDCLELCAFGLGDSTFYSTVQSEFPASLQNAAGSPTFFRLYPAYKFEVRPGGGAFHNHEEVGNQCVVAYSMSLSDYKGSWWPRIPIIGVGLYNVTNEPDLEKWLDWEPVSTRVAYCMNTARDASQWAFLAPGTYVIAPSVRVAPISSVDSYGKTVLSPSLPDELIGKPIKYAIRVFTETETQIELIRAGIAP